MSAQVARTAIIAIAVIVVATLAALVMAARSDAQTAGVTITQSPANTTEYLGKAGEIHAMVAVCPVGMYAASGGWSVTGAVRSGPLPSYEVVASYPSQLPGNGELPGAWTLVARKLTAGPLSVTPYVTCLGGVGQIPE